MAPRHRVGQDTARLQADYADVGRQAAAAATCPSCGSAWSTRVGTDVQEIRPVLDSLLGAHREAYLGRLFTARELADVGLDPGRPGDLPTDPARLAPLAASLAARFAVKEAVVKVLRPAPEVPRPPWTEIETCREPGGWVRPVLHGSAARTADEAGLTAWSCSVSHDGGLAVATVVSLESCVSAAPH